MSDQERERTGDVLELARMITFATRSIDHCNGLECELIEKRIAELALNPQEVADLIWAVVDYRHQPIEELRNMALHFEGGRVPGYQFIEGFDEPPAEGEHR